MTCKPISAAFAACSLGLILSITLASAADKPAAPQKAKAAPKSTAKTPDPVDLMSAKLEPTRIVVYKKVGDRELTLHLFEPAGHKPTDRRPCFLAIHGGGWTGGEPRRFYPFADHFAKQGMLGISLQYRLMKKDQPGNTPFECVKDGRSAMRWIRSHAAELGIDPQKIVASGGSAGGHVAAATALFDGIDEPGEDTSVSPVPNALVLYFPVIDTSSAGYGNAKCGPEWEKISPVHRVKPNLPPTIIFHATGDTTTPFHGSELFRDAMLKAGNHCELIAHEGGSHGYLMRDAALLNDAWKKSVEFLVAQGILARNAER